MASNERNFEYSPVSYLDLITGSCQCDRCGKVSKRFFYVKAALCIDCALDLHPPKICLTLATNGGCADRSIKPLSGYSLWNNTHLRQEHTMGLNDFVACGWFIRKVEETFQLVSKRTIKTIDLEYYGHLICVRAMDHYENLGLEDLDKCRSPFCEFMYKEVYNQ